MSKLDSDFMQWLFLSLEIKKKIKSWRDVCAKNAINIKTNTQKSKKLFANSRGRSINESSWYFKKFKIRTFLNRNQCVLFPISFSAGTFFFIHFIVTSITGTFSLFRCKFCLWWTLFFQRIYKDMFFCCGKPCSLKYSFDWSIWLR